MSMASPNSIDPEAEALFLAWLEQSNSSSGRTFEDLCARHPDHAPGLRRLRDLWGHFGELQQRLSGAGNMTERMRARFAAGVDPRIELDRDSATESTRDAQVFGELGGRAGTPRRYGAREEIAVGGMGMILRVWDEDLRRNLAMKVMLSRDRGAVSPELAGSNDQELARFLEEAQVTAQLDHPGIVPVHEVGLNSEGKAYFTMKLVKGRTLRSVFQAVREGEEGWTRVKALGQLARVCEAMAYAHDKGVIHRDLKPANVMVGRFGEVYVMDWGLAKILGREDGRDVRIRPEAPQASTLVRSNRRDLLESDADSPLCTMDGDVVGTPAYMSPEQARGEVDEMGPPSDVYAMGAMLYHLLAGHPPYLPPRARAHNQILLYRVQEGPPPSLNELAPDAAPELIAIAERAMAREIAGRYADMSELARDLTAFLEGRVVQAYRTGALIEGRMWVQRNKAFAASVGAALLLLVAALFVALGQTVRADAKAVEADELRIAAQGQADRLLRFSDDSLVRELSVRAESLWPIAPEGLPELEAWTSDAAALVRNLELHEATLLELREAARPVPEASAGEFTSTWQGASLGWDSYAQEWEYEFLERLIDGLHELEDGLLAPGRTLDGVGPSIPDRLAAAEQMRDGFAEGGEHRLAWERDLEAIRADYDGLEFGVQTGLVPIGRDEDSGLWEFAHVLSGEVPERRNGELVLTADSAIVLVLVRGGSFSMGAQSGHADRPHFDPLAELDEGPVHVVELSPYFISKYELTQGQWLRMTGSVPSRARPGPDWDPNAYTIPVREPLLLPVELVSWNDCARWLPRFGLELPTEAQWERGVRGDFDSVWWDGDELESLQDCENVLDSFVRKQGIRAWGEVDEALDDGASVAHQVGTYRPNPFGLHDMGGNVAEWCRDVHSARAYAGHARADPVNPGSADDPDEPRVWRGGSFNRRADEARSAYRGKNTPSMKNFSIGVRPARAVEH